MKSVKTFWTEYCEKSSLHGLRYVVHKEATPWERLLWAVLMAVASVTILVHLYASWKTFSYSSIQIVVDDPRFPLSKIDFPAVTICSINKILYSKAKRLVLSKYENEPELKKKYENSLYTMEFLQYPYYKELPSFVESNPVLTNFSLETISDLMLKLMPTVDEMFDRCYWRGTGFNCSEILRLQRTEEGFCYSFNSKTSERMANDSEFNPPIAKPNGKLIPLKNNVAGKMTGLELIMKSLITEYFPNDKRFKGYNIMIHTPEDFPDIASSYKVYSELNQSSRISVSVSHIRADESLHRLDEKERKCFFYETRTTTTKNFPSSRSNAEDNCYSECRLKSTYKMCNCTPYYFDMKEGKQQCGIEHVQCLSKIKVLQHNARASDEEFGFLKWNVQDFMNCSCPHPCSFVGYTTEIRNYAKDFLAYTKFPHAYTHIEVHYKERFAISYLRSMKYTTQDLLVTFGGMASLFLGCSLVSVVELIYVIYKSLIMLKHKYTKVQTLSKHEQQLILYRRQRKTHHFCKPLYIKPPGITLPEVCKKVKY
ncbi:sodium channel protein Nach-like [Aphis gossypii]|uniref:sodium channel protein Nach-like n=1 Tax=Aphis gossypii TaxID=80765 RepID=UPI0021598B08|nr:sodium channel protein Nach-like [Aphis gossypii]